MEMASHDIAIDSTDHKSILSRIPLAERLFQKV